MLLPARAFAPMANRRGTLPLLAGTTVSEVSLRHASHIQSIARPRAGQEGAPLGHPRGWASGFVPAIGRTGHAGRRHAGGDARFRPHGRGGAGIRCDLPRLRRPAKGQPVQPGQHVFCPICVTLAQAQGFAAPDITFVQTIAWQAQRPALPTERLVIATVRAAAFDSQAPPALAVL